MLRTLSKVVTVGDFTDRIEIHKDHGAQDDTGEWVPDFKLYHEIWCAAYFLSGEEREAMDRVLAGAEVQFNVRYRRDITSRMQVKHLGQVWNIGAVVPIGNDKQFMTLVCAKVDL